MDLSNFISLFPYYVVFSIFYHRYDARRLYLHIDYCVQLLLFLFGKFLKVDFQDLKANC